jgi:hypothetical protein
MEGVSRLIVSRGTRAGHDWILAQRAGNLDALNELFTAFCERT